MARKAVASTKVDGERVRIDIRVSPGEHAAFVREATRLGLPLAAWLRMVAREASKPKAKK